MKWLSQTETRAAERPMPCLAAVVPRALPALPTCTLRKSKPGAVSRTRVPPSRTCVRAEAEADKVGTVVGGVAGADEGPIDESTFGAPPWDPADGEDPISDEVLLKIVLSQIDDQEVNDLVWTALGYTKEIELDMETLTGAEVWKPTNVFPKWAAAYPEAPDVIGVTRKYWPEIDGPVKAACAALTRSVADEHKQGLKRTLRRLGWKGYRMDGLTPNMTRRAQAANWLLKRRREERRKREEAEARTDAPTGTTKQGVV